MREDYPFFGSCVSASAVQRERRNVNDFLSVGKFVEEEDEEDGGSLKPQQQRAGEEGEPPKVCNENPTGKGSRKNGRKTQTSFVYVRTVH